MEQLTAKNFKRLLQRAGVTVSEFAELYAQKFNVDGGIVFQHSSGHRGIGRLSRERYIALFRQLGIQVTHADFFSENLAENEKESHPIPQAPDQPDETLYYPAPLVSGRIAAGPGRIVDEDVESWVWIYGPELKGRRKHELVAVRIGRDERSMVPTLYPGDIVLIDRDDPRTPSEFRPGRIYAVRTSATAPECAIKRLYVQGGIIILSSDNRKYPPEPAWTSDIRKLIIGRVVWGWRNLQEA